MEAIFGSLTFFGTPVGLAAVAAVVAVMLLLSHWRIALAGLFAVQLGAAAAVVQVERMPGELAGVMTAVMGLACLILALSAQQSRPAQPASTWTLRLPALVLVYLGWRVVSDLLELPLMRPEVTSLLIWLAVCALAMLGLDDSPLAGTVALLLWCIPVQAVVAVLLRIPALNALIGALELVIALAGSYLVLAERLPVVETRPVLTDISFPTAQAKRPLPPAPAGRTLADGFWPRWRGALRRGLRMPGTLARRQAPPADPAQGSPVLVRRQR